ncbi:glycosyltransferase family 4 protein [Aliikangiella coralliicola]|uniref:Glycosyltransferase family 4 protein n=1 Tax=Aliikangiella coralliicola TaxID=2592383 RepID=A0A545UFF9_9GAMM|nr:glycosyltransferase family 4 protein [Aliikangiella coralliicola]TQV88210.1 glycosyltransferase family 4 protein [Aliikangiella coralliicola]
MNILVFTTSNGPINSIRPELEIFLGLARRGHSVTVLTDENTEYANIFKANGIKVINQQPKKKICFESIKVLRKELREKNYDVVYATNSKSIPNAAFACIGFPTKMITYRGTTGGLYKHDPTAYLTHLHPRVDGIICVSDAVRDDVRQHVWRNKENVVTIYKGHHLDWYDKSPADLSEFGISDKDFVLICAVNARPSKGIPVMIEAADQLADLENLHLLLVGKNMDQYADIVEKNKMRERIHITGYRYDAPELIVASDLLVQPSISGEGLPRAVMEAMGYGTPTIVTTTGGGKEVVENGVNGIVVPTKDPDAIAANVRELYHSPERIKKMSENCRQTIAGKFSVDSTVEEFVRYFEKMTNQS